MNKIPGNKKQEEKIEKEAPVQSEKKQKKLGIKLDKPMEKNSKEQAVMLDDSSGVGINLIPTMTKEEVVIQESKKKINVGSIVSLLALVVVSLGIVGFNIISKMQLNSAKERLYAHEQQVLGLSQKIINNNEILERVKLFQNIQKEAYSPKEIIEYVDAITKKSGQSTTMADFSFGSDLSFSFSGSANDLEDVSKLWYLLTKDSKIESINLDSVGKNSDGVKYSFEGKLVFEEFINSSK